MADLCEERSIPVLKLLTLALKSTEAPLLSSSVATLMFP